MTKWTMYSLSNVYENANAYGNDDLTSHEQICGNQTVIKNETLGIEFRVNETGEDSYKVGYDTYFHNWRNEYSLLMNNKGIRVKETDGIIKKQLEEGFWTGAEIDTLIERGLIEGIAHRLERLEEEDGKDVFLGYPVIKILKGIEAYERDMSDDSVQDKIENLQMILNYPSEEKDTAAELVLEKYMNIQREEAQKGSRTLDDITGAVDAHNDVRDI